MQSNMGAKVKLLETHRGGSCLFEVSAAGGGLTDAILSEVAQYLRLLASYSSVAESPAQQPVLPAVASSEADVAVGGAQEAAPSDAALPLCATHEADLGASNRTMLQPAAPAAAVAAAPAAGTAWASLHLPKCLRDLLQLWLGVELL